MCVGTIATVVDAWDDGGARAGLLDTGAVVSLAFVPDASPGSHVLVHLGIPVEVIVPEPVAVRTHEGEEP